MFAARDMSDLGWKLRRLRAMTPAEIIHRAKIFLRNKLAPPAYEKWTPAQAFSELFAGTPQEALGGSLLSKLICSELTHETFQTVIEEANALLSGKWKFFGRHVQLSEPPNWRMNYWTGQEWPDLPSSEIDYHRYDIAGGAKFTWEIGRLTFLPS